MASTLFQPYVDKENAGARPKQGNGVKQGLGGKVFQSSGPNLLTPARSALRDRNQDPSNQSASKSNHGIKGEKPFVPVEQLFKKPALQPVEQGPKKSSKAEKGDVATSRSASKCRAGETVLPDPLPPIEHMYIYDAEKEEVKPERDPMFVGLIETLRKWRPPCLFGYPNNSDSEDEEPEFPLKLLDVPESNLTEPGELESLMDEELINLSDIPIPFIDEDLPIAFLDDTIDIEPNMGTLEVWDTSTPYKVSDKLEDSLEQSRDSHDVQDSP